MFTINSTTIENDVLVANVTLEMADKSKLIVNVPVKFPKTKEDVINAVIYRESLETVKYEAAPTLTVIKEELDTHVVGVAQTAKAWK